MSTSAIIAAVTDAVPETVTVPIEQVDLFQDIAPDAEREHGRWARDPAKWDGRGRKPGARNRVTQDVLRYCEAQFGHPIVRLAAFAGADTDDVASRLECSKAAAFDRQMAVSKVLAEFYKKSLGDVLQEAIDSGSVQTVNFGLLLGLESKGPAMIGDNRTLVRNAGHESEQKQGLGGVEDV